MARRQIPVRVGGRTVNISPTQLMALRMDMARAQTGDMAAERCYCLCHDSHDVRHRHSGDCCAQCAVCGERILVDCVEAHAARHQ